MAATIRRIGILTGGGDCPGLNAVIRAVTKTAIFDHGFEVMGIEDGFAGLVEHRLRPLDNDDVSGILTRGGTILGSNNRSNPQHYPDGTDDEGRPRFVDASERCLETIERAGLEALIVVGGDGTMSCAAPFVGAGVRCIGVPKTIDNDLHGTDITFGFTTAMTTATMALDRLHTSATSHHRVMVCELMGRHAGWLTLHAGVASGADVILIPEIPYDPAHVHSFLEDRFAGGRRFAIVACAEGAHPVDGEPIYGRRAEGSHDPRRLGGIGASVASAIEESTGIETRTTVLGHIQRGGEPVAADRVLATRFGHAAIDLLAGGASDRLVVMRRGVLDHIDLREAANRQRLVPHDDPLVAAARAVRTCFGDAPRD